MTFLELSPFDHVLTGAVIFERKSLHGTHACVYRGPFDSLVTHHLGVELGVLGILAVRAGYLDEAQISGWSWGIGLGGDVVAPGGFRLGAIRLRVRADGEPAGQQPARRQAVGGSVGKLGDELLNGEIFYTLREPGCSSSAGDGSTMKCDRLAPEGGRLEGWAGPPIAGRRGAGQ